MLDGFSEAELTGDPIKDFEAQLQQLSSEEAKIYIKMGRNAASSLMSLQYRTDWSFDKKADGVKLYHLTVVDQERTYIRADCKF